MARVTAVVPVKGLAAAKTRLDLAPHERARVALAFAVDTVTALQTTPGVGDVLVVTSDGCVVDRLAELDVRVVRDPAAGLVAAVREGLRRAAGWQPGTGAVVVPADLPCLRPADVAAVLGSLRPGRGAFVPDRSGSGTTLLARPADLPVVAHYGPASAWRHRAAGLRRLGDAPARARHDVDTLDDLAAAFLLGVGEETRTVTEALGLAPRREVVA